MLSLTDLPMDDGALPAGKWVVHLRDGITDSFGGATFRGGITVHPVDGRFLKRLVIFQPVVGAMRVVGEPCELGDCSALKPKPEPVVEAAKSADTQPVESPQESKQPEQKYGKARK